MITILQRRVVRRRGDVREQRVAVGIGCAAALDLIGDQFLRMRLALVGRFLIAVDEHDINAGLSRDIGDPGAHEAGAEHADFLDRLCRYAGRTPRALVQLLHGDEQRADHRRGFGRTQDLGKVARLDPQRLVHRQLQALIDDLHDGACSGIIVVGLAPIKRVRRREHHHAGFRVNRPTGQLEAVDVPRCCRLAACFDPILGFLNEFTRRHDLVDKLHRFGAIKPELIALEQVLQRIGRRHHARDTLGAAATGKKTDFDFGQAEPRLVVLGSDPVMACECKLEAAAHGGAVKRRDPRLAGRLHAARDL
jgi:hypothetical protein